MRLSVLLLLVVTQWLQFVTSGPTISERNLCVGKPECRWPLSSREVRAITKRIPVEPVAEPHDPENTSPEPGNPDSGKPNSGNPNAGNPNAGNPNAGNPNAGNPNAGKPQTVPGPAQEAPPAPPPPAGQYVRPQSYTVNGKNTDYPAKGQQVIDNLNQAAAAGASRPNVNHNYPQNIGRYFVDNAPNVNLFQVRDTDGDFVLRDNLESVFEGEREELHRQINGDTMMWRKFAVYGTVQDREHGMTPISVTYSSHDGKTIIVSDSFNDEVPGGLLQDYRIFHSDIWHDAWTREAGPNNIGDLKMIIRANIHNTDTQAIIRDARIAVGRFDNNPVSISATAPSPAEQDAFKALAGSENGKQVFRMLADYNAFGSKKVVCVRLYKNSKELNPNSESLGPAMVWVLTS